MWKALGSIPSTTKKGEDNKEGEEAEDEEKEVEEKYF
jgi:hypothetical protein